MKHRLLDLIARIWLYFQPQRVWVFLSEFPPTIQSEARRNKKIAKISKFRGAIEYANNGLRVPKSVQLNGEQYKKSIDIITRFVENECVVGDGLRVTVTELHTKYKEYCKEYRLTPMGRKDFSNKVVDNGYKKHKRGSVYFLGLKVRPLDA